MHGESNMPDRLHSGTENVNQMQVEVFVLEGMWVLCTITHGPPNLL